MDPNNEDAAPGEETPGDELTLDQQLDQVEQAAEAVSEALEAGDTERAANILGQLETWRENLSSTLEAARSQSTPELAEALAEIRSLRADLNALRNPTPPNPSQSQTPSDHQPPTPPPTPIPKPPSDGSPMELPESGGQEEAAPPPVPESPRQKRRGI